jgi:multimeric flavodoxin WrbA
MKAFIINGARNGEEFTSRIAEAIGDAVRSGGGEAEVFDAWKKRIEPCVGCDGCGYRTPGICVRKDDGGVIAERTAACDLMVFVSAVAFGTYSAAAKRAIERTMPNLLPFFLRYRGEMHHRMRYVKLPALLTAGWQENADEEAERLFRKVGERNGINYLAPAFSSFVVSGRPGQADLAAEIGKALSAMKSKPGPATPVLPLPGPDPGPFAGGTTGTVLLISGANCRNSNSAAIADYVAGRIRAAGGRTSIIDLSEAGFLKGNPEALIAALGSADRILFINPLYHDTLSYATTLALEQMAKRRAGLPASLPVSAFVHSGYPESVHARTAVAVLRKFVSEMGWLWMGGFSAGATSPIGGKPLEEAGGLTKNLRKGLDIAAEALAQGRPIPEAAVRAAARPFIPHVLFLRMGNYLTRKNARKKGIKNLNARPYAR